MFDSVSINLEGKHARWLRNVLSCMDVQELPEDEEAKEAIAKALDACNVGPIWDGKRKVRRKAKRK